MALTLVRRFNVRAEKLGSGLFGRDRRVVDEADRADAFYSQPEHC